MILIVEDDEQINDAIKIYLTKENYEIIQAFDGKEALDKFVMNTIDLIILDIMIPELNGKEVLKQIRAVSDVPVIILTALSKEYDKLQGFQIGADDYITKPFSPRELAARINALFKRTKKSCPNINKYLCI